jgi:hypothetical protein
MSTMVMSRSALVSMNATAREIVVGVASVVTNETRAMVVVLDEPGDADEHATDPTVTGQQRGYVLANGQHDAYDNRDTLPLQQALMIVKHVIEHGHAPAGVGWQVDR